MKRTICMLLLAALAFAAFGCQPDPEKDYVITKDSEFLEEKIAASPVAIETVTEAPQGGEDAAGVKPTLTDATKPTAGAATAAPWAAEKWEETITSKNFVCRIDAEIVPPASDRFPVWKIEPGSIDAAFLSRFIEACASPVSAVYRNTETEQDLKEQLEAALRGEPVVDEADGTVSFQPYDGQQDEIDRIAERLRTYDEQKVSDPGRFLSDGPTGVFRVELENGTEWIVRTDMQGFSASSDSVNELIQTETMVRTGDAFPGEPMGSTIDVPMAQEDAVSEADRILKSLGIENMGVVSAEKARTIHAFAWETTSTGWLIEYRRSDNGSIPVDFLAYSYVEALVLEDDPYAVPWHNESLNLYITEEGLSMLAWKNPKRLTGVLNENVELLPFSEIMENAKNLIFAGSKWTADADYETEIVITRIFMTYGAIRPKNTNEYRYLLPVWVFEYRHNRVPDETCFFAINAVDGTRAEVVTVKMAVPK